jgi:hypothetical protein
LISKAAVLAVTAKPAVLKITANSTGTPAIQMAGLCTLHPVTAGFSHVAQVMSFTGLHQVQIQANSADSHFAKDTYTPGYLYSYMFKRAFLGSSLCPC